MNILVSSQHFLGDKIGYSVLEAGGNAIDASIAISFCLGYCEPYSSGLGGGGSIIFEIDMEKHFVDYRESIPINYNSLHIGVPSFLIGQIYLSKKYGKMRWDKVLNIVLTYLKKRITFSDKQFNILNQHSHYMNKNEQSFEIFSIK